MGGVNNKNVPLPTFSSKVIGTIASSKKRGVFYCIFSIIFFDFFLSKKVM